MAIKPEKCLKCPKRVVGCHSTCKDYLEYRASLDAEKKKIYEAKKKVKEIEGMEIEKRHRLSKEQGYTK